MLVMRTALQPGIVTPQMEVAPTASTLYTYTPEQLWCVYCGAAATPEHMRVTAWEADALMNELLRDQPAR